VSEHFTYPLTTCRFLNGMWGSVGYLLHVLPMEELPGPQYKGSMLAQPHYSAVFVVISTDQDLSKHIWTSKRRAEGAHRISHLCTIYS
jgi:hypothetical protein